MRVVPVIDLMHGQVVRGIAGRRAEYRPIQSTIASDSNPTTIARAFSQQFGFNSVYVADLDAIEGRAPNLEAWKQITDAGLSLWIDAGIGTPNEFSNIFHELKSREIPSQIVIALESLVDPDDEAWSDQYRYGPIFSLDLKHGLPRHNVARWSTKSALEIARSMHARGYFDMIVLDLADVGVRGGTSTLALCKQLRAELHPLRVTAGGGVRSLADLQALQAVGCDAALVASALHDKRLTADDLRKFTN